MQKTINMIALIMLFGMLTVSVQANSDKKEALKETVALMLNANGHLCAKVTDISLLQIKNQYEVTCIAYRGGKGTKTYVFNAADGTAFEQ